VLVKWPGDQNLADVGTKVSDPARIEMLIAMCCVMMLGISTKVMALSAMHRPGKRARNFLASLLLAAIPSKAERDTNEKTIYNQDNVLGLEVFGDYDDDCGYCDLGVS